MLQEFLQEYFKSTFRNFSENFFKNRRDSRFSRNLLNLLERFGKTTYTYQVTNRNSSEHTFRSPFSNSSSNSISNFSSIYSGNSSKVLAGIPPRVFPKISHRVPPVINACKLPEVSSGFPLGVSTVIGASGVPSGIP